MSIKDIGIKNFIIILICGVFLVLISVSELFAKKDETTETIKNTVEKESVTKDEYVDKMEKKLENILKNTNGAGDVEVMITIKSMKEQVVLKDEPSDLQETIENATEKNTTNKTSITEESTVIFEDSEGNMMPYVLKELEPTVTGVVVIAQGADDAMVKNEIIDAIQVLFDIPIHKIKVMKMNNK